MSLDAKKAFDSVDHEYLFNCLKKYNFSENFIRIVQILYTDLKAKIMINGYLSEALNIEQSVKQGDALSCDLFIICIDSLIRMIINNNTLSNPIVGLNSTKLDNTAGYADDVADVVLNTSNNINTIFKIYEKFSVVSGLFLSADKTEILTKDKCQYDTTIYNKKICIKSVDQVQICGRVFSYGVGVELRENITNKIAKLRKALDIWSFRSITLYGKILHCKTFGMSQIIYSMMSNSFELEHLEHINDIMSKFIWSNKKPKLKFKLLMSEPLEGGLGAPDAQS